MADYSFVTIWQVDAPIETVWEAIIHSERWPSWWQGVEQVIDLEAGQANGIGRKQRYVWQSVLPYKLAFNSRATRIERPYLLEGEASGELEGIGRWQLSQNGSTTTVRYDWNIHTTKPWMNVLAPLARPFFEWNHDVVMGQGGRGLARLLGTRLLNASEVSNSPLPPAKLFVPLAAITCIAGLVYMALARRPKRIF